jgi:hypothetical protein
MLWIETDLDGKELGRWDVSRENYRFAMTRSGDVYAHGKGGITMLNHATGKWVPVTGAPGGRLSGAHGDQLVFYPDRIWYAGRRVLNCNSLHAFSSLIPIPRPTMPLR